MEEGNAKEAPSLSAKDVADAFLNQYYTILKKSPKEGHKFYQDQSTRTHPCADGSMKSATTLEDIDLQIMESIVKEWNPDLDTVHAQESLTGSVILGVTGSFTDNDNAIKHFSQTFFLAPQDGGGFYVHNDFLQLIEIINNSEIFPSLNDATNSVNALQINVTANESSVETEQTPKKEQADKSTSTTEDAETKNEIADSSKGKGSLPAPLPAKKNKKQELLAWKQALTGQEDAKKVSYASIVAKEGPVAPTSQSFTDAAVRGSPNTDKKPNVSIAVTKPSPPVRSSALPSNGPQDGILDLKSIRVKDLPPKMTQESLVEVLKKFGSVKPYNIQIKEYPKDGYRYAFVEFDNPKSVRLAVETRFIQFEDTVLEIQHKRSANQGGNYNMGRPMPGRGGFRNDNSWGHDGEGRGSGSWGNGNWGNRHNEHDNNNGQFSGQARDNNFRRNRYSQDQGRNFGY